MCTSSPSAKWRPFFCRRPRNLVTSSGWTADAIPHVLRTICQHVRDLRAIEIPTEGGMAMPRHPQASRGRAAVVAHDVEQPELVGMILRSGGIKTLCPAPTGPRLGPDHELCGSGM